MTENKKYIFNRLLSVPIFAFKKKYIIIFEKIVGTLIPSQNLALLIRQMSRTNLTRAMSLHSNLRNSSVSVQARY